MYKKIYIEVKTTANKTDVEFQVSRNEVETSNELDKDYKILFDYFYTTGLRKFRDVLIQSKRTLEEQKWVMNCY